MNLHKERTILACFIIDNSLFREGLEGLFESDINKTIYKKMITLKEFNLPILADSLDSEVDSVKVSNLLDYLVHSSFKFLAQDVQDCIEWIDENQKTKKALIEVNKQLTGSYVDIQEVRDIISGVTNEGEEEGDIEVNSLLELKEHKAGFNIGYSSFDRLTGKLLPGELYMIMGRTTTGKTWLLLNILKNMVTTIDEKVGFFSMEMAKPAVMERLLQHYFDKGRDEITDRFLIEEKPLIDLFLKKLDNLRIFGQIYSIDEIRAKIRAYKFKIIFIDFLGLVKTSKANSLYEKISSLITDIKKLAKEENILIFLAHQLSRQAEDGSVQVRIHHARDSGAVEELTVYVIGIWRPEIASEDEKSKDRIFVHLLKNKKGLTKKLECHFNKKNGHIREVTTESVR